jgi:cellulose synthase/poly-beta-1,6-N-acetylglucosamine synthase-like glycosyltransferase
MSILSLILIKPIYLLLGFSFLMFCIQLYYYIFYYFEVAKKNHKKDNQHNNNVSLPPVSVIICAKNEAENIKKFLKRKKPNFFTKFGIIKNTTKSLTP